MLFGFWTQGSGLICSFRSATVQFLVILCYHLLRLRRDQVGCFVQKWFLEHQQLISWWNVMQCFWVLKFISGLTSWIFEHQQKTTKGRFSLQTAKNPVTKYFPLQKTTKSVRQTFKNKELTRIELREPAMSRPIEWVKRRKNKCFLCLLNVLGGRSRSSGRSIKRKQTPSSLNYVTIGSSMQWLEEYRQS
jgi:hypothetical protein